MYGQKNKHFSHFTKYALLLFTESYKIVNITKVSKWRLPTADEAYGKTSDAFDWKSAF